MGAEMILTEIFEKRRQCRLAVVLIGMLGASCAESSVTARNEEYGLVTRFPAGKRVCTALSGLHPIGFYIWINRSTDCEAPKPPSTYSISITASYNSAFEMSPSLGCRDSRVPAETEIDMQSLAFPGLQSVRCATSRSDGTLDIVVSAQAGKQSGDNLAPEVLSAPRINYEAWLQTTPARAKADLSIFRQILANTRIEPPTD